MTIGAQLFTLREYTQTPSDLDYSLGKVAEMGYKTVQLCGSSANAGAWRSC